MCVQASRLTGSLGCVITGPWLLGLFGAPGDRVTRATWAEASARQARGNRAKGKGPMITPRLAWK